MEPETPGSEVSEFQNSVVAACSAVGARELRSIQNILLVEDQSVLREVMHNVLQCAGYPMTCSPESVTRKPFGSWVKLPARV